MFKLQIILIPPRAFDLQVPNHSVVSSPNNSNGRIRFPTHNSKHIKLISTNNITTPHFTSNSNADAIDSNSNSVINCSVSTPLSYHIASAVNQRSLKQQKLRLNQIIAYRNQLFQKLCKKFLLFINFQSDLNQLANEILLKFKDMYPNFNEDINIVSIQDNNGNDLDPDYIVKDIFNTNNIVKVLIDKEVDWNNPKYLETKYTRYHKRRKLNPKKYSNNKNHNNYNRNVPNIRVYTPRVHEVYRDIDSVIMDDTIDQSILKSSSKFHSSNIISTPNVSPSNTKTIDDIGAEKAEEQGELYDQSSLKETLLGTPVISIVTPNKLTNSQQKLYSNDSDYIETVKHPDPSNVAVDSTSSITSSMKTPTAKNDFANPSANGISTMVLDPSKAILSPLNSSVNVNKSSGNKNLSLVEMDSTTVNRQKTNKNHLIEKELKFKRPSALSMAKRVSLQRQQSTIANDRGSPMRDGQLFNKFSENVHLAELPTKPNDISDLKNKQLENSNKSKSIFEKIMEHQKKSSTSLTSNNNNPNVIISNCKEKKNLQGQQTRQIINNNSYDSNKSIEDHNPESNDEKQKSNDILLNSGKNQNDHQQKNDQIGSLNAKCHLSNKKEDQVKDKPYLIGKLDILPKDSVAKHTCIVKNNPLINVMDKKVKSHSEDNTDINFSSKLSLQPQANKNFEKSNKDLEHPKPNLLSERSPNIPDDVSPTPSSAVKSKETSQNPKISKPDQLIDKEYKKKDTNDFHKESLQLSNDDERLKDDQMTKISTQTSKTPVVSNNSAIINTQVTSDVSQASPDILPNVSEETLPPLIHNQKESINSHNTSAKTPEIQVADGNDSSNKKVTYDISSRNPSFQKVELLEMFENDNLKTPPWLSRNQNFTIERVIGKSKKKPYLTVLNKDIDNSEPDPRNILPSRIPRNAARKASLKLSGQAANLKDYASDNDFNETEEFESYSESEGEYESTSSSGIMSDVSSDEEVIANLAKAAPKFTILRHDLKESIVSHDITDTKNNITTNSKQSQTQSNKKHNISSSSVCRTNDRDSREDKLVKDFSPNEMISTETKSSSLYRQNNIFEKTVAKNNISTNNINNNLSQPPIHPEISQSNVTITPETIVLSDESNDSDEPGSPAGASIHIPNRHIFNLSNPKAHKSTSITKDNNTEASTFMDYLKHPEVGEDLLLDLYSSESNDHSDNDDIYNISSSSSDFSIKEVRQVQFPIKTSQDLLTMDETVHNSPSSQNNSGRTSILHPINSKSTSVDNRGSLEFVTNTSTNISNRLQRLNNINLVGTTTAGSIEFSPLTNKLENSTTEEKLAETSSEYETSSVELY